MHCRDFAIYDPRASAWTTSDGVFELLIGASSQDIRLRGNITVIADQVPAIQFSRLSPVRDWLRHPVAGAHLKPMVSALQRQLFGHEVEIAGVEHGSLEGAFIADMPIAKLIMFGVLSESDLISLIEATQHTVTTTSPG